MLGLTNRTPKPCSHDDSPAAEGPVLQVGLAGAFSFSLKAHYGNAIAPTLGDSQVGGNLRVVFHRKHPCLPHAGAPMSDTSIRRPLRWVPFRCRFLPRGGSLLLADLHSSYPPLETCAAFMERRSRWPLWEVYRSCALLMSNQAGTASGSQICPQWEASVWGPMSTVAAHLRKNVNGCRSDGFPRLTTPPQGWVAGSRWVHLPKRLPVDRWRCVAWPEARRTKNPLETEAALRRVRSSASAANSQPAPLLADNHGRGCILTRAHELISGV